MRKLLMQSSLIVILTGCGTNLGFDECWPKLDDGSKIKGRVILIVTPTAVYAKNPICPRDYAGIIIPAGRASNVIKLQGNLSNSQRADIISASATFKITGTISLTNSTKHIIVDDAIEDGPWTYSKLRGKTVVRTAEPL